MLKELDAVNLRIRAAAEHGDLKENSEYQYAIEQRNEVNTRIMNLSEQLDNHHLIDRKNVDTSKISVGCRAILKSATRIRTVHVLGMFDADFEQDIYNYEAPLCKALIGKRLRDIVDFGGEVYEVIEIGVSVLLT